MFVERTCLPIAKGTFRVLKSLTYAHGLLLSSPLLFSAISLFLGPVAGTCLGFGAAYAVSQKRDNFWKDSARALGEVSILAHARAQAIDEKYHVVENSLLAVQGAWEKLRSWSHYQPEAVEQSKEMVVSCCVSAREFCTKHRLVKRGAYMTTQAAFWLGQSLDRALAERRGVRQGRTDSLTAQR